MSYFPFFIELAGEEGLIAGGGMVALRKIRKLLPYGPRLSAAAPDFLPELETVPGLTLLRQPFEETMLDGKRFVVAATDDLALNRQIAEACRQRKILVNVVDDREACGFLFPALVQRGALSIGISTGGASPSGAIYWKERIAGMVPEDFGELLEYLDSLRERAKEEIPTERARAVFFADLFARCMKEGFPLDENVLEQRLKESREAL